MMGSPAAEPGRVKSGKSCLPWLSSTSCSDGTSSTHSGSFLEPFALSYKSQPFLVRVCTSPLLHILCMWCLCPAPIPNARAAGKQMLHFPTATELESETQGKRKML